ncbi:nucleoside diphosphate-linked moiety X motif 19-like [Scaptodrosophila lebanonensis]|uniref:Nucleoside diphosphate-linked moiety X motif 19-like n=1 Tax=Drosophila lebanonensis TaxID=7225 RepID=A0A6J2TQ19_DROLE|nr:nucleoside diphosphate-linked moiety X motif 19-like [Scaptodrosophila lebanonensis]
MSEQQKTVKWRTSASLIIVAKNVDKSTTKSTYDYNLLMLKRSAQTAIVQNQAVFPGGLLDTTADENVSWLQYFEEFGVPQDALRQLVLISDHRPSILAPQGTGCYDRFFKRSHIWAREITLRLTALRECFEEVGVLLCRTRAQLAQVEATGSIFKEDFWDREIWQQRVHNKPSDFLKLCRKLQVVPDLWALHEWSAWASPAIVRKGYETVFFIAFVEKQPNLLAEESEVKECLWRTPTELLSLARLGELWFLPPQIYELSRLLAIRSYYDLLKFARHRSKLGTTLFMPISYMCSDNLVNVLPGDDFYLAEPHLVTNVISFEGTVDEFHKRAKKLHRLENFGTPAVQFHLNFPPPNGHLPPLTLSTVLNKL